MRRTLVELKFGSGCRIHLGPGHVSALPMLKNLTLDSLRFDSGQFHSLLSACPVLEALDLVNVHCSYSNETVSSASLKTLTIKSSSRVFSFDTPNLVCLNYTALVYDDYPLVNLEYLFEAQIKFVLTDHKIKQISFRKHDNVFLNLGNVYKLSLFMAYPMF